MTWDANRAAFWDVQLPVECFSIPQRGHCVCGWVADREGGEWERARARRLISYRSIKKLFLSHHRSKLLNACCVWHEHIGMVLWSVPPRGLGFTPQPVWPSQLPGAGPGSPSPARPHPFPTLALCWDHTATRRHAGSLSNLSIRSGAGPADAPTAGVVGWEHIACGPTEARNQGKRRLVPARAFSPSAALPSPSCWCWCSRSYQVRDLMQLKADMTIKQNTQRYTAVGIVLPPSSTCQHRCWDWRSGRNTALAGQRRAGKQGLDVNLHCA